MRQTIFSKNPLCGCNPSASCRITACHQNSDKIRKEQIVTGISADFDYLNPLLIQLSMSRELCTLLYPSLVKPSYDEKKGEIPFCPMLPKAGSSPVTAKKQPSTLSSDAVWEDGKKVTSHDFKYSYALYKTQKLPVPGSTT